MRISDLSSDVCSSDLLFPQLGRHCVDQPRFTAGQQEMRAWLGLHVDPGMEMQEMGVDRWGHGAGVGVDRKSVVSGKSVSVSVDIGGSGIIKKKIMEVVSTESSSQSEPSANYES